MFSIRSHSLKILKYSLSILFSLFLVVKGISQDLNIPVTEKEMNDKTATFRFAVVSDRTGGMREDIFAEAIKKLNLMQPEFVISVGDLIDGYTEDPKVWNKQWNEFDALVNKLAMPFYYVPGNHDTSNELLTTAWRERHGKDYYHFIYKNVLFIVLNTDELKNGGISKKQINYVTKALQDNQDVRTTLLFMHRPLWSYGEQMGYEAIENALQNRRHTVFSGHHHHYQYQKKNGMDHYVLATTGGGSYMRNPEVGEFDHITWVTMKNEEPILAHLELSGIYDKNIVPSEDYEDIQILRQGNWLQISPVVNDLPSFKELNFDLLIENRMQRPMNISGDLLAQDGIRFEPQIVEEELQPGESKSIGIKAHSSSGKSISIEDINNNPINLQLQAGFKRDKRRDVSLSTFKTLAMDWKHELTYLNNKIEIDGELNEWQTEDFISVKHPQFFYEGWDWKGAEDGTFQFSVKRDDKNLYIAVKFEDDFNISDKEQLNSRQDKFYIHLDPSLQEKGNFYQFEFATGRKTQKPFMNETAEKLKGLDAAISLKNSNQNLELKVPLESIKAEDIEALRINIGIMDHDRAENTKPSVLWWRPVWDSNESYEGSSTFYKRND